MQNIDLSHASEQYIQQYAHLRASEPAFWRVLVLRQPFLQSVVTSDAPLRLCYCKIITGLFSCSIPVQSRIPRFKTHTYENLFIVWISHYSTTWFNNEYVLNPNLCLTNVYVNVKMWVQIFWSTRFAFIKVFHKDSLSIRTACVQHKHLISHK